MERQAQGVRRDDRAHGGLKADSAVCPACAEFVARSFAVRTAAHLAHLSTTSYETHVALEAFYEDLLPAVDRYAEVLQGLEGLLTGYPALTPPAGEPLKLVEDYLAWVQAHYDECAEGYSTLKNILDEVIAITARTAYKLRFLK